MSNSEPVLSPVSKIAIAAVLTAVTAVFTYVVRIPIPLTKGYFNLGDVAIYFAAFTFGPVTALIAGGLGTAIADLVSGYAQWAPISLVAHGLQGLVIGLIAGTHLSREGLALGVVRVRWIIAVLGGTIVMCGGYFVAQVFMLGIGAALAELFPANISQNVAGVVAGIPLSLAVRKAYPPVRNFRW
jgi:uncharacterized membrane protein